MMFHYTIPLGGNMFSFLTINSNTSKTEALRKERMHTERLFAQAMRMYGVSSSQAKKHDEHLTKLERQLEALAA
jgi:uncharacterized protein involved in exopolysaccharide biosynthesis